MSTSSSSGAPGCVSALRRAQSIASKRRASQTLPSSIPIRPAQARPCSRAASSRGFTRAVNGMYGCGSAGALTLGAQTRAGGVRSSATRAAAVPSPVGPATKGRGRRTRPRAPAALP